jgi:hypothetical protein
VNVTKSLETDEKCVNFGRHESSAEYVADAQRLTLLEIDSALVARNLVPILWSELSDDARSSFRT